MARDFKGLKDVSALSARAAELNRSKAVRDALKKDAEEDDREKQMLRSIWSNEARLGSAAEHEEALLQLRQQWKRLSEQAKKPDDSVDRRLARRVLSGLSASTGSATDPDYLKIVREFRTGLGER
jgi:hypothetical protein